MYVEKRRPTAASNTIARKLLRRLLFFGAVIIALSAITSVLIEYVAERRALERLLDRVAEVELEPITGSLWVYDVPMLTAQLEALVREPAIAAATVRDQRGIVAAAGTLPEREAPIRTYSLDYTYDGVDRGLGKLDVYTDHDFLFTNTLWLGLLGSIYPTLVIIALALLLYATFHRLVVARVLEVTDYLRSYNTQYERRALVFRSSPGGTGAYDELDEVADAINSLRDSLNARHAQLMDAHRGAEREVRQKTRELEKKIADLERTKVELTHANQARNQFLANMSHELRTPITGIMGIAKVLARTDLDETQRDYTRSIEESGRSLLDIVEDLLDFSKLEADRIELSDEDLDPHEIVDRVVRLLDPSAEAQSCSVSVEHGPAVPHRVRGDALRLQQVLRNLLSNAVKFSPGGEVVLRVEAAGEPTDGSVPIRFTVSDTGVGIPDAVLPRVFESFYQVDGSYSKQFKGTGLGLAISKRLVEMMGGEITAESTEGEGSTFCFTVPFLLPVEHVPAEAEEHRTERTAGESHANAEPREEGGLRILVAEDNAINRLYLERFLEAEGHLVSAAADGHAVLEAIAAAEFDLILMDIQMPGLDGMETTRRIRTHSTVPIVALTAYARSDELESFIAAGMNAAVTKPVHEPDLRRVISEIAGGAARD